MAKAWHIISYDVRDDKRLRRVAQLLEGYGERLQYSVFRCRLSEREVERLRWELAKVMDKEDDLLLLGLCDACVARGIRHSRRSGWPKEPAAYRVL